MTTYKDNEEAIKDLLRLGGDIPILEVGAFGSETTQVSYPTEEHIALQGANGRKINSHLNLVMRARTVNLKKLPEGPDKAKLTSYKDHAAKITFSGTTRNKSPKADFEVTQRELQPLIITHITTCLTQNKGTTAYMSKLLTAEPIHIDAFSTSREARKELQLKSLCSTLLADNPYAPGGTEDTEIEERVFSEMAINAMPTEAAPLERFRISKLNYQRAILALRDMVNHTYLRAIYMFSTAKAQEGLKQCHLKFLKANAGPVTHGTTPPLFTATNIIDYIENDCLSDNSKLIVGRQTEMTQLVRRTGSKPLLWLEQHEQPIRALKLALGTNLSPEQIKEWKVHFASQFNMSDRGLIEVHGRQYLLTPHGNPSDAAWKKVNTYLTGVFDTDLMKTLLTGMDKVFKPYETDEVTGSYIFQHAKDLGWQKRPDFRPDTSGKPERARERNPRPNSNDIKRDRNRENPKGKRREPAIITAANRCRRKECINRNTYLNHTHDKCRYKETEKDGVYRHSHHRGLAQRQQPLLPMQKQGKGKGKGGPRHPNLGLARQKTPPKPAGVASAGTKDPCFLCKKIGCTQHKRYNCSGNHRKSDCPKQPQINSRLHQSKTFMSMMADTFSLEQQQVADKLINTFGAPVCPKCLDEHPSNWACDTTALDQVPYLPQVRTKMLGNSGIMDVMRKAHFDSQEEWDNYNDQYEVPYDCTGHDNCTCGCQDTNNKHQLNEDDYSNINTNEDVFMAYDGGQEEDHQSYDTQDNMSQDGEDENQSSSEPQTFGSFFSKGDHCDSRSGDDSPHRGTKRSHRDIELEWGESKEWNEPRDFDSDQE